LVSTAHPDLRPIAYLVGGLKLLALVTTDIFTELVGIQMLLMSALDPLLRGEKMAQEQLAALYRRVQTTKAARAQELLAKRNLKKEK